MMKIQKLNKNIKRHNIDIDSFNLEKLARDSLENILGFHRVKKKTNMLNWMSELTCYLYEDITYNSPRVSLNGIFKTFIDILIPQCYFDGKCVLMVLSVLYEDTHPGYYKDRELEHKYIIADVMEIEIPINYEAKRNSGKQQ